MRRRRCRGLCGRGITQGKMGGLAMRVVGGLIAAVFLCLASPAVAQQIEGIPNFKGCKDDSLDRAMKDGITLGISPSPPYSSLDPNTKKADGLDVEIHEAALNWIGIKDIKYEV